ncbi:MAG: response regulator [Melioribacteraceae bacterium]|nr:response regulator [Melioribacteraceae bacterium]
MLKNLLIVSLCIFIQLTGQIKDNYFIHLDEPISQNTVTTIIEDSKGFLWFGTAYGLNRFDGIQILVYEHNFSDSISISNNYIRKIVEDKNGDLWIATEHGLNRYDRTNDKFIRYFTVPGDNKSLSSDNVSDVIVDRLGRIWVAAGDLCLFQPESNDFVRYEAVPDEAKTNRVTYHNFIYEDISGTIWYGYWNDLFKFDSGKKELQLFINGSKEKLGEEGWHFHEMLQDKDGYYWIATNRAGLIKLTLNDNSFKLEKFKDNFKENTYFSNYRLLALFLDKDGNLWVSLENAGLVVIDADRKIKNHIYNNPDDPKSISGNSIWSICQDSYNRIWFGIWNSGVNYIDPFSVRFDNYQSTKGLSHLSNDIVTDFLEDKKGNLWIATDGGGLNYFDRKSRKFSVFLHNPSDQNSISSNGILSLCFDDKDRLWIGTWNGGINIYDQKKNKFTRLNTDNSRLASNDIFDLLFDGKNKIYVATYHGGLNIFHLDDGTWETYKNIPNNLNSISSNNLFTLYQDSENKIWIGSLGDGLNKLKEKENGEVEFWRYQYYPQIENGISNNVVHCIHEDLSGRLWVATSNGLNLMDRENGSFKVFGKDDGLLSNYVSAVTEDSSRTLWISSLKGISSISPDLKEFNHYDLTNNIQGYSFNRNSVYKTGKGEILFGGSKGFNIFDPKEITVNPFPPRIVFTDFKISNKSEMIGENNVLKKHISETKQIELSYYHTVFTLEFTALNYTHPEKNQYAYMLEGFEDDWIYSGNRRNVTYTNLDAGDYVFRVKAANNNGVWNNKGIELLIRVHPPFWKTWWAYLFYAGTFFLILYIGMKYYIKQEKLRHELELEHIKIEKLSELDKIKSRFFSNVSHEIRTPIMLIVGPLERLLKSGKVNEGTKEKVSLIIRNAERLSRMMEQLINFYETEAPEIILNLEKSELISFIKNIYLSFKQYALDHNINFSFNTNVNNVYTWFDKDIIDKIIYNILSNAFKFTPDGGEIGISINVVVKDVKLQNYIEILISDSGIGIPEDQRERIFERFYQVSYGESTHSEGIGIGLNLTHELVELHQGKISVESEKDKGTLFRVILPADIVEFDKIEHDKNSQLEPNVSENKGIETIPSVSMPIDSSLILFIDDEPDMRHYVRDLFSDRFQVLTAKNGREGFEKAIDAVPDIIISDIMMPELDGYELCRKLKSEEKTSHIPIILLTAHSEAENRLKGIKVGAVAYLPKPFDDEELFARVNNLLLENNKIKEKYRQQILSEPENSKVLSLDEKFMIRIKQVVEDDISNWKMDADYLSSQVGISRVQLYRKLKGLTGQTVHEFIRIIRLKRAKQLLDQRKMNVTEIAYYIGFKDLNYFSRCFRKQYGKSPSEYLSQNIN